MITSKVLTAEEAIEKTNEVGLDRAIWDGLLFSLTLLDGSAIEIKSVINKGEDEVEKLESSLCFIHNRLRLPKSVEQY